MRQTLYLRVVAATASCMALGLSTPSFAEPRGGFAALAGSGTGSGYVESSGGKEAIRCRARYQVGSAGSSLDQRLVCASASFQFNIESQATVANERVSGSWSETTRGVTGEVSGTLRAGQLEGTVRSPLFTANLGVFTRGNNQDVVILPEASDVRRVSVQMRRS